jgi:hypothetical protein
MCSLNGILEERIKIPYYLAREAVLEIPIAPNNSCEQQEGIFYEQEDLDGGNRAVCGAGA